jgi:hypothetical protein
VKLWDVGFAIVHTLERSVWAMLGNHSSMARVANGLIQTGQDNPITVECGGTSPAKCAIPNVTSGMGLDMEQAWRLLDRTLLLMGTADLDLANGYYIYIMSALYFAVPAVAGQLVLGAKAGMASMAVQGISQVAGEAGNAAKSATVGENVNKLQTNQGSLAQAAVGKSHRQSGLALQQLENSNAALDAGLNQSRLGATKNALGQAAEAARMRGASFSGNAGLLKAAAGNVGDIADGVDSLRGKGSGAGGGGGKGAWGQAAKISTGLYATGLTGAENGINQQQYGANARSAMFNAGSEWASQRSGQRAQGLQDYGRKLGAEADFAAQTAAWEAKNDMATHLAGIGGVSGMNPGALSPGNKPTDMTGMAMAGQLGGQARAAAQYSGFGFMSAVKDTSSKGSSTFGSSFVNAHWGGGYSLGETAALGRKGTDQVQSYMDQVRQHSPNGKQTLKDAGANLQLFPNEE